MARFSRRRSTPSPRRSRRDTGRVTIREVAARAGVSVATISRVLNKTGPVRDETSRRVLDAASALRYVPDGAARSLSTRRTNTIGLLLPDLHGEFFSEVIRGIDGAARASDYHLLVSGFHSDRSEMTAMLGAVRGRVDGLIIMSPDRGATSIVGDLAHDVPHVLINSVVDAANVIGIDNYGGASAMVRHLASVGHRRIAFICGPKENADASERLRGYRRAIRSLGLKPIEADGDFSEDAGRRGAERLLSVRERPNAIFAANDSMALGALAAIREAGLQVPRDVALAGFDDIPIARYVTPPLTTVNVAIAELGRRAFEKVVHAVRRETESIQREKIATRLVIRESCGAAANQE
jgi:LacI family transcriptional regulator